VVTLDTWLTGWRPRDLAASNFPQLRGHCLANYTTDPVFLARLGQDPARDMAATVGLWAQPAGSAGPSELE
jgi:lactate 2-monooxygenase